MVCDMALPADTCRLCASSGNLCVSIFGQDGAKILLKHKLRVCSPVIVKENDSLPKQVCLNCLSLLDQSYDFYQQAKSAQLKLTALIDMEHNNKRGLLPDSGNCENGEDVKRICFGTTFLTFTGSDDGLNQQNVSVERTKSYPPLYVVMGEKTKSDNLIDSSAAQDSSDSAPSKPPSILEKNSTHNLIDGAGGAAKDASDSASSKPPSILEKNSTHSNNHVESKDKTHQNKCSKDSPSTVPEESKTASRGNLGNVKQELFSPTKPATQQSKMFGQSPKPKSAPVKNSDQKKITLSASKETPQKTRRSNSSLEGDDGFKACQYCEREFPEEILHDHVALHEGKRLYSCDQCSRTFFHETAFHRHVQKRHGEADKKNSA